MSVHWDLPCSALTLGQRVNLVVKASGLDGLCEGLWHHDAYICHDVGQGIWTLLGFQVTQFTDYGVFLSKTTGSMVFPKPQFDFECLLRQRDIYAGVGGLSSGTTFAGCHTILAVDRCGLACHTLQCNNLPALKGDLSQIETLLMILKANPGVGSILSASFALPLFGGQADCSMLHNLLVLAWLLQSDCLLLECPQDLAACQTALDMLRSFAEKAGLRVSSVQLDLAEQWASRRNRWWHVLVPCILPPLHLLPWSPCSPRTLVGLVLPEFPTWPENVEQSLAWTEQEMEMFTDPRYGADCRLLDLNEQAPTALHCWGATLTACPCGCRAEGLPSSVLETQGISGLGVYSSCLEGIRLPHAAEVGFLNSLPACHIHAPDNRAALCLAGCLTAPLQAIWVYGQLRLWATCLAEGGTTTPPEELVCQFKALLHQSCLDAWNLPSLAVPGSIWVHLDGALLQVGIPRPIRAQELTEAEKALAGPGHKVQVFRGALELPPQTLLRPNAQDSPYKVQVSRKASQRDPVWQDAQALVGTSDITLWTGLLRLQAAAPRSQCFVVPPRCAARLLDSPGSNDASLEWPSFARCCLLAFVDQAHWSLLALFTTDGGALATHFDGVPGRSTEAAKRLANSFCALCGVCLLGFKSCCHWQQTKPNDCGAIALAHAAAALSGGTALPSFLDDARNFVMHMPFHKALLYGFGGLSEELQSKLESTLLEKGVPIGLVKDRIQAAVAKLGPGPIASALAASNVWQALKAAGSTPGAMFRWIRPEEVKALAETKASATFGAAVANAKHKKQKTKSKTIRPTLQVDPDTLQLVPGSFKTTEGSPLAQLAFSEVVSQASGVAFCSPQQALPFLQAYSSLSVDALAVVCTSALQSEVCTGAPVTNIQFPAIYSPTQEAILLQGSLLQLGDEVVQLDTPSIAEVERLDTITGRLSYYRDEASIPWTEIAQAPLRALVQHVPCLSLCKDANCHGDCACFHPSLEETVDRMILDAWGRSFAKVDGGRAQPDQAELFQVMIRVPGSALKLLHKTTTAGFYFEPRANDGFSPHASFAVVWLPGKDKAQVQHILRTCDRALAITRLGRRFGIRVKEADEKVVHAALKPEVDFVKLRISARYRLHPLPHGMQRLHLAKLLKEWKWPAKPLQPAKGDAAGSAWEVGAECEPPAPTLPAGTQYVLITKLKDLSSGPKAPAVCASHKTRQHMLRDEPEPATGSTDPWAGGNDPWSAYRAPPGLPAPPVQPSPAGNKLAQMRTELKPDLQSYMQQQFVEHAASTSEPPSSAIANQDARIQKLEVGVQELQLQNRKFEGWFQSFGTQLSESKAQVTDMQKAMQSQQADVVKLRGEVSSAVGSLKTDMNSRLDDQLQRIEALLSKKPRTE